MASGHLSIEDFFTRLSSLFQARRNSTHGSIYLTQKRLSFQSPSTASPTTASSPSPDSAPSSPPVPILVRASNGKSKERRKDKIKLSTVVQPDQLEGFFTKYAEIVKGGATALKKRDRSGRKKATKAKKKGKAGGGGTEADKK
ncbi:hypothetical protein XPA_003564 [Xanthoria parietina]